MLYITGLPGSSPTGINLSGHATVTLTPPTSDTYQGVVLFEDRNANGAIVVSGNAALNTTGTEYAPAAQVILSGNDTTDNPAHSSLGAQWIVADLTLTSNARFTIAADALNRVRDPNAFLVAGGAVQPAAPVAALTPVQVEAAVKEAVALWGAAGVDAATLVALSWVTVTIAPLPAPYLGLAAPGVIYLDSTAEGHGWFIDVSATAAPSSDKIDLLTVVTHELGHLFGLMDGNGTALMASTLAAGLRILPHGADLLAPHMTLALSPVRTGPTAASNPPAGPAPASEIPRGTLADDQEQPAPLAMKASVPGSEDAEVTPPVIPTDVLAVWSSGVGTLLASYPPALLHDNFPTTTPGRIASSVGVATTGNMPLRGGQDRIGMIGGFGSPEIIDVLLGNTTSARRSSARKVVAGLDAAALDAVFQTWPLERTGLGDDGAVAGVGVPDDLPRVAPMLGLADHCDTGASRGLTLADLAAVSAAVCGLHGAARDAKSRETGILVES
jgi:hypothetical protein